LRDAGLNRGSLHKVLSEDGNPALATLLKITRTLGPRLRLEPIANPAQGMQPAKHGFSRQGRLQRSLALDISGTK
jgi:hypothetical protein